MDSQNDRKKHVSYARWSFIILISGSIVTLLAYTVFILNDSENYIFIIPFIALVVLVLAAVILNLSAYTRKQTRRFKIFRTKYPNSYLCQPDLDITPHVYAITRDHDDLAIFDISQKQDTELLRMPMSDVIIKAAEVSTNGVLKFAGLEISSSSYTARFVLLDHRGFIIKASSSHTYATDVAEKLSIK